jgi:two-component system sensor histidine kinase DctS
MEDTQAMHHTVLAGQAPDEGFEITFMRKNGERFQALIYEAKLIDGHGRHTGWMASILDIKESFVALHLRNLAREGLVIAADLAPGQSDRDQAWRVA